MNHPILHIVHGAIHPILQNGEAFLFGPKHACLYKASSFTLLSSEHVGSGGRVRRWPSVVLNLVPGILMKTPGRWFINVKLLLKAGESLATLSTISSEHSLIYF